jgi:C4-dicarboxylate transporter DctM subunit
VTIQVFDVLLLLALVAGGGLAFSKNRAAAAVFAGFSVSLYFLASPSVFTVLGLVLLLLILSTPLFVTIGVLTFGCLYFLSADYQEFDAFELVIGKIFGLTDQNVLLAIPFFVVAGSVMTAGGIARRIVDFADALIGWLPGGMAAVAVLSCMFFAAISGSSPVTVIAIGSIMMPALVEKGYGEKFSLGLVTTAGSLGILIPPSIPMIIYAIMVSGVMSVNVADLFMAGIGPGLLIGGLLIAYSVIRGIRRPDFSWRELKPPSLRLIFKRFVEGFWALLLPVVVLGGIYPIFGDKGIFTPTEAAALAVVYAFVVELFIHREIKPKAIPPLLFESAVLMGSLLGILVMSFSLNHFLVEEQIPDAAVAWMTSLDLDRVTFLIILNIFLLLIGCLMDIVSAILIVAPLVAPIAAGFGIDPLHLGIIFVVNLEIGYLTPPIGLNLFVSATLFSKPIGFVIRAVASFTAIMLLGLVIITWAEPIAGGIPRVLNGGEFFASPAPKPTPPPKMADDDDLDDDLDDEGEAPAAPAGSGVKSVMELMKAQGATADQEEAAEEDDDDLDEAEEGAEDADSGRVKSVMELMKEQGATAE